MADRLPAQVVLSQRRSGWRRDGAEHITQTIAEFLDHDNVSLKTVTNGVETDCVNLDTEALVSLMQWLADVDLCYLAPLREWIARHNATHPNPADQQWYPPVPASFIQHT